MGWIGNAIAGVLVLGAIGGGAALSRVVPIDLVSTDPEAVQDAPYPVRLSGQAMNSRIADALRSANIERVASREVSSARILVLEKVTYERSAGGVVARGSLLDPSGPRSLRVVLDAYDDKGNYMTSDASPLATLNGATAFSAALTDDDAYQSFNVRFFDGQREIPHRSASDPILGLPALAADDALYSADLAEVWERLASLGYVAERQPVQADSVVLALVRRFRRDHAISGPGVVSISDLLALRLAPSRARAGVNLSTY